MVRGRVRDRNRGDYMTDLDKLHIRLDRNPCNNNGKEDDDH